MSCPKPRAAFLIPLVFLLGIFSARLPATVSYLSRLSGDFFSPIEDVERMLADSYVTDPDAEKLQRGAIDGMLDALDDPYAQYIPPTDRADFEKELLGRFCGIGAQVQIENGLPTIVTPLDDSPAFRAGILAGDKIVEVDQKPTTGMPIEKVVELLVGEPNTKVHVKIRRDEKTIDFDLVREEIVVRAVKGVERTGPDGGWNYMLDPGRHIGYIRLSQFIPTAPDEMAKALTDLGAPDGKLNGLILDLRNNPGGDLDSCLEIADMFIKDGTIVSVRGRQGPEQVHQATAAGTLPDFPMVVLVNGFSASASEILSGALSDHKRATIIGSRTFGKGLVQTVRSLPHKPGAQVKYTIQHYFLPSGRLIQRTDEAKDWGVDPTPGFYIPMTDADELAYQLKRRSYDVLGVNGVHLEAPKWSDAAWLDGNLKDKQLAAAVRAMDSRLAGDKWSPQSEEKEQFAAFSMDELHRLEKTHQRMLRAVAQIERRMDALDEAVAGSKATQREPDLWPNQLDLTKGEVKVYDKDGKVVADLRITGPDLEQWLALADVEPVKAPDDSVQKKAETAPAEKKSDTDKQRMASTEEIPELVLGIETSCDETAAAVVDGCAGERRVLSNVIASQDDLHAEYRGVVPEIASRAHAERILPIVQRALADAGVSFHNLRGIAVGHRPGLIGCLLVGVAAAKSLAWSLDIPFVGVDHIHAHLYAGCLDAGLPAFPALGLVVSGGHTSLFRLESPTTIARLGGTIDDAIGEAYDKVATILGIPFPGGPKLDKLAATGNPRALDFPVSRLGRDSLDFSFSGLKTAVLYAVRGVPSERSKNPGALLPTNAPPADVAASFQRAAVRAVIIKLERALALHPDARSLLVGGGVSANSLLRTELAGFASRSRLELRLPTLAYCLDNAAMIAGLGHHLLTQRNWASDPLSLSADPISA